LNKITYTEREKSQNRRGLGLRLEHFQITVEEYEPNKVEKEWMDKAKVKRGRR
jgi:hypothetical protein